MQESGEHDYFNPRDIAREVADQMRVIAQDRGLALDWSAASEVPAVLRGDPRRLRQVLTALIGTGIECTERGHLKLEAALAHLGDSAATVRFGLAIPGSGETFSFTAVFQRPQPERGENGPAPARPEPNVHFNPEALPGQLAGDRKLAAVVLKAFLDDVPHQLYYLRQRLAEGDAAGIEVRALSLSQAAESVAADGLRQVADSLRHAGQTSQLDRCAALLPLAALELERFQYAMESAGWL